MKKNFKDFRYTNSDFLIFCTTETYSRAADGGWEENPYGVEREIISPEFYENYITSIPFFDEWGEEGSCNAVFSTAYPGYLPTAVTTISPYGITKIVARFDFLPKSFFLKNAGWREKEVVKKATRFNIIVADGAKMIVFLTDDKGVTASGTFDTKRKEWRA